ncbi:MAG: 5-formyltetrahydrofolate cyclo-ligase [Proteobacteria bacterium]|nr:5-formyltetrahydrofolate cyclo-ligase [Pseudomonadota bacterium]
MTEDNDHLSAVQLAKQALREELALRVAAGPKGLSGRTAELLRRDTAYRSARQVFVSPVPSLQQVRINCLLDGKELIVPAPGLKDGFYLLKPYSIPFQQLPYSVTLKGFAKAGQRMTRPEVESLAVSLLVTDAVAVDRQGNRLGDGLGFFDLSVAILTTMGAISRDALVATCIHEEQMVEQPLPIACWDVPIDIIVTEQQVFRTEQVSASPRSIFWEHLPDRKIRKITPLWWLSGGKNP